MGPLRQRADALSGGLGDLNAAAENAVTFSCSSGGAWLGHLIAAQPSVSFEGYEPSTNLLEQNGAAVLFTIDPDPDPDFQISSLHLGLYVYSKGDNDFWLLRAPAIPGRLDAMPTELIDRYHQLQGPLPTFRQQSVDVAFEVCERTCNLFRDMAHRYLSAVANADDLASPAVWTDEGNVSSGPMA